MNELCIAYYQIRFCAVALFHVQHFESHTGIHGLAALKMHLLLLLPQI